MARFSAKGQKRMNWTQLLAVLGIFVTIVAIVTAIYGFIRFIDWRVERKIHVEPFLRKIADSLRPTVIFDENGSILIDQGAMKIIEKIDVVCSAGDDNLPEEIVIYPNRHLAHAPLLQGLEDEMLDLEIKRAKGYEWRYRLNYVSTVEAYTGKRRFRLEVFV